MNRDYGHKLYRELMNLMGDDSPFYYVDHEKDQRHFRVFTYRLASYTDFLKPSALECRGVMFEIDWENDYIQLMSLPMSKFFNVNENPMTMDLDFSKTSMIMDKMDGSLMTTYLLENQLYLKSKTALASDQAIAAMELFNHDEHAALYNYLTYMEHAGYSVSLEFTSPKFRIVLGYQDSNLTVLCARDKSNGEYVSYEQLYEDMVEFGCEKYLVKNHIKDIPSNKILEFIDNIPNMTGIEGYVLKIDDQYCKLKTITYQNLHRSKDAINSDRNLFECVVNEIHDDLRGLFADDLYVLNRIDEMVVKVKSIYRNVDNIANKFYRENKELDRKSYAIKGLNSMDKIYFNVAMSLYLNKPFDVKDWMIKHYKDFNIGDDSMQNGE